jgi:WD40 repeat protein
MVEQFAVLGKDDHAAGVPPPTHRYTFEDVFASGGFGQIRRAYDHRLQRVVAIKELRSFRTGPANEARFRREATLTARLEHPSIVPVHDIGTHATGETFMSMKYVNGDSLEVMVRASTSLGERLALVPHVLAVADALAYAHEKGVVHRDLKPSNVLVGTFGETIVIDWGLAKELRGGVSPDDGHDNTPSDGSVLDDLTRAGEVVGTLPFMPPEQLDGGQIDARSDVYAIGAMLYFVLSGRTPYGDHAPADVPAALRAGALIDLGQLIPAVSNDLLAIVRKAMARVPDERYVDARALAADLRRFQDGSLITARYYSPVALVRHFLGRHRAVASVAVAALVALTAGTVFHIDQISRERDKAVESERVARRALEIAEDERQNALVSLSKLQIEGARQSLAAGHPLDALADLLDAYKRRRPEDRAVRFLLADVMRIVEGLKGKLAPDAQGPASVSASESLPRFIRQGADGTIELRKPTKSMELVRILRGPANRSDLAVFFDAGRKVIVQIARSTFEILDGETGVRLRTWSIDPKEDATLHAVAGGDLLFQVGKNDIQAFEAETGRLKFRHETGVPGRYPNLVKSANESIWATVHEKDSIYLWSSTSKAPLHKIALNWGDLLVGLGTARQVLLVNPLARDQIYQILDPGDGTSVKLNDCGRFHSDDPFLSKFDRMTAPFVFSEDGLRLFVGMTSGSFAVWDTRTGVCEQSGNGEPMVGIKKVGKHYISFGADGSLGLWSYARSADGGRFQQDIGIPAHEHGITDIASIEGGRGFVSAGIDGEVRSWSFWKALLPEIVLVNARSWQAPAGDAVASIEEGTGDVLVQSLPNLAPILRVPAAGFTGQPREVQWLDAVHLIIHGDTAVEVWDRNQGRRVSAFRPILKADEEIDHLELLGSDFAAVHTRKVGHEWLSAGDVAFWDWRDGTYVSRMKSYLGFRPNQLNVAKDRMIGADMNLYIWPELTDLGLVFSFADFSRDGRYILNRLPNGALNLHDGRSGKPLRLLRPGGAERADPFKMSWFGEPAAFFPHVGQGFFAPRNDGKVDGWIDPMGEVDQTLKAGASRVVHGVFREDDRYLATVAVDGVLQIWEVPPPGIGPMELQPKELKFKFRLPSGTRAFAFSAKNDFFAALDGEDLVIADLAADEVLRRYRALAVERVFFGPEGDLLYTIDRRGTLVKYPLGLEERSFEQVNDIARWGFSHVLPADEAPGDDGDVCIES